MRKYKRLSEIEGEGMYVIVHHPSGVVYPGVSVDLWQRMHLHRSRIETNTHENRTLRVLSKLHGPEGFRVRVFSLPLSRAAFKRLHRRLRSKFFDLCIT